MADKELVRLRSPLTELLSPAMVVPDARGTVTVHDEPVVGGGVNGYAGQEKGLWMRCGRLKHMRTGLLAEAQALIGVYVMQRARSVLVLYWLSTTGVVVLYCYSKAPMYGNSCTAPS